MKVNYTNELSSDFQASVLLAGWPGMGSVGVGAIDYLRRKLDAKPLANVDMLEYFTADAVVVEDGIARLPDAPTHIFYGVPELELIIFQSEAQIGGTPGIELMDHILDLGEKCGVDTVLTCASYIMPVSHKEPAQVLGVANNAEFRDELNPHGVEILEQGLVSGLNGLLLGFAGARSLNAACLMGTMPQYAATIPNPKASRELVRVLERFLNCDVDMDEINEAVEKMEHTMEDIESQIHKAFSSMESELDGELEIEGVEEDKVPQYVMERIESLFVEVMQQPSQDRFRVKANLLKKELDHWNLYHFYEDRFLDLFKTDTGSGG
ncbi:MAG: hypothetical protein HOE48_21105 [Candidatus Latescibacteria bacterium]|jgi:uncharacterized protein|nr:hypothetical protein [Candidatus Latescibacterota bacterium]MBT4140423.1 hypothetical protein [Candidatus Latescibacterota bacterium]